MQGQTMHKTGFAVMFAAALALGATVATANGVTVIQPIDAAQQARGHAIYAESCAACHGANREGGAGPALGPTAKIAAVPANASAADLARWIKQSMPKNDPGSLSEQASLDVVAYILSAGVQPAAASSDPGKAQ